MARNQSELAPRVLLQKMVRPAGWADPQLTQLVALPTGGHTVRVKDYRRPPTKGAWHVVVLGSYDEALALYERLVPGFYFNDLSVNWTYSDAA